MNEIMTIQLYYDEDIERENQKFLFKLTWKKFLKDWKKLVLFTLLIVFLGFYPIKNFDSNLIYYLIRFGAIYLLIYWVIILRSYIKAKKEFQKKLDQMITELNKADQNLFSIILNETLIEIKNPFNNFSSVWDKTSYQLIENRIIISFLNNTLNFVLDQSEFRNADFEILKDYIHENSSELF